MAYRADGSRSTSSSETDASSRAGVSVRRSTSRTQDIDRHVGARIRERRIMLGLTQQQLADLIGVTSAGAQIRARHQPCLRRSII